MAEVRMPERNDALHVYTHYVAPQFTAIASLSETLFPLMADGLGSQAMMDSPAWQTNMGAQLARLKQIGSAIEHAPTPSPVLSSLDRLVREVGVDWQEIAALFERGLAGRDVEIMKTAFSRGDATNAKMLEIRRQTDQLRRKK
jgi:hypothetical protein